MTESAAPVQNTTKSKPSAKPSGQDTAEGQRAETRSVIDTDPSEQFGATVIKLNEPVPADAYKAGGSGGEMVELKADLVGEFYYPDTRRPSHTLLFHKGQMVAKSYLDALDAAARQFKVLADNDGVDPENPAGIDSTTIASGTKVG